MNLTVTTRIAGGAGLVVLLLILVSFTGLQGVSRIDDALTAITDKSTPMLIAGSDDVSSLLKSVVEVNQFHRSKTDTEMGESEKKYQSLMKTNRASSALLKEIAHDYPEVLTTLEASDRSIIQFSKIVPVIFEKHRLDISLGKKIEVLRDEFEEIADELDSNLYDLADEFQDDPVAETLQDMSNMVRETTVIVTDALVISDQAEFESVTQEVNVLIEDLVNEFNSVQENSLLIESEVFSSAKEALNSFKGLTVAKGNISEIYSAQLAARSQAKNFLNQSNAAVTEAQLHLNEVFSKIKELNLSIKKDASNQVDSSRMMLIAFALIAIFIAILVNYWVLHSITNPLKEVLRVIKRVSKGDLTEKADVYRQDELGMLSNGFNDLIDALRGMLKEIGNSSQQLAAAAEQTSTVSQQSHKNINHQKNQVDKVVMAMGEMTSTVDEVSNGADKTLAEVKKANKDTLDGQSVVQESITTINQLASEIEGASGVIDQLADYSNNIGTVLDVIRGIADQTNLLALNAAIEAARAGEQGRGFAVVADEVRTLASKTQDSTSEIQKMIERLQAGTTEAVAVMTTSRNVAQHSVNQTEVAGQSLQKITQAVSVINDMSTLIGGAVEQQSRVSKEMHENVLSISEIADRTASGASENLSSSRGLASLAAHMQKLVSQFKY